MIVFKTTLAAEFAEGKPFGPKLAPATCQARACSHPGQGSQGQGAVPALPGWLPGAGERADGNPQGGSPPGDRGAFPPPCLGRAGPVLDVPIGAAVSPPARSCWGMEPGSAAAQCWRGQNGHRAAQGGLETQRMGAPWERAGRGQKPAWFWDRGPEGAPGIRQDGPGDVVEDGKQCCLQLAPARLAPCGCAAAGGQAGRSRWITATFLSLGSFSEKFSR